MAPRREAIAFPGPSRFLRKQAGLGLEDVVRQARALRGFDITARTISHIESGDRQPSADVFWTLAHVYAEALDLTADEVAPVLGRPLAGDEDGCSACKGRGWIYRVLRRAA